MPVLPQSILLTLGHSLWQALALAIGLWVFLRLCPPRFAGVRYGASLGALVLTLFSLFATYSLLNKVEIPPAAGPVVLEQRASSSLPQPYNPLAPTPAIPARQVSLTPMHFLSLGYAGGVLVMFTRLAISLSRASALVGQGVAAESPLLNSLLPAFGLRSIRLLVSPAYRVPAVVGFFSPAVLLPSALLTELSPDALRMIFAHELAHVRRWDFLINIVQGVIESLLFFNPALWWISAQIRHEREACADAVAVRVAGSPQSLAAALASLAESVCLPRSVLAATGPRSSPVIDRIRRLLTPATPMRLAFPTTTLLTGLLASALLLVVLHLAAQVTVAAAEQILSPKERIDKIAEVQKQVAPTFDGDVVVAGTLTTEDGSPLPKNLYFSVTSRAGNSITSSGGRPDTDGNFSHKIRAGVIQIVIHDPPGFAPLISTTFTPTSPGNTLPPIDLVLSRGYATALKFVDAKGNAIPNVKVSVSLASAPDSTSFESWIYDRTTDALGTLKIANAPKMANVPIQVSAQAGGYQDSLLTTTLSPEHPTVLTLPSATPTVGMVVDAVSKQPLANATVSLIQRKGVHDVTYVPNTESSNAPPALASTDAQGRFTLNTLADRATYVLWVSAPNHGSEMLSNVRAGDTNLVAALGPSRAITVQVHLPANFKGRLPTLAVSNPLTLDHSSWEYAPKVPLTLTRLLGNGDLAPTPNSERIAIGILQDPIPGKVSIALANVQGSPDTRKELQTADLTGPITIHLRLPGSNVATTKPAQVTRQVVVKLTHAADAGLAVSTKGFAKLQAYDSANDLWTEHDLDLSSGQATIALPVPTRISIRQNTLVGYVIPDYFATQVPVGSEPFSISLPATPAGAIYGVLRNPDGSPVTTHFYVSLVTDTKPSDPNWHALSQGVNVDSPEGRFLLPTVALNASYRLVITNGPRTLATPAITLDNAHALHNLELKYSEGATVQGTIEYAPNPNSPAPPKAGITVELQCLISAKSSSFGTSESTITDAQGHFSFAHIQESTADSPKQYTLVVKPTSLTQAQSVAVANLSSPVTVTLQPGLTAKGRLIDSKTKQPLVEKTVRLVPDLSYQGYRADIEVTTDRNGEFVAQGLSPTPYNLYENTTLDPKATINYDPETKNPVSVTTSGNSPSFSPTATETQTYERQPSPWKQ